MENGLQQICVYIHIKLLKQTKINKNVQKRSYDEARLIEIRRGLHSDLLGMLKSER